MDDERYGIFIDPSDKKRNSEVVILPFESTQFWFPEKFHTFLNQCGVITYREMSMVLTRRAGAAESTVTYTRNMDFLFN